VTHEVEIAAPPRATAFGLDIWADRPLTFLHGGEAEATGRRLDLRVKGTSAELEWPATATLISDERDAQGGVLFRIERAATGYRIEGPHFGTAVLARDAATIAGAPGAGGMIAWQRLLIAQVLPFAAVVRGLEVMHASAVALDGGAVAIVGRSGAGKTSLAVALSRGPRTFLTDDVLALERRDGRLLAHPGPPVAGVARAEGERLRRLGHYDEERVLAEDAREVMMAVASRPTPTPLRAILILDRRPDGPPTPRFEPVLGGQELLASTFNLLLLDPERLEGMLDVCALASTGLVERVTVGDEMDASDLARAVVRRLRADR
jgi:hypothetical protein